MAERSIALDCKSNGFILRRFESCSAHKQNGFGRFLYERREKDVGRLSSGFEDLASNFGACEQNSDKVYCACKARNSCSRKTWGVFCQDSKRLPDILRLEGVKISTTYTGHVMTEIPAHHNILYNTIFLRYRFAVRRLIFIETRSYQWHE